MGNVVIISGGSSGLGLALAGSVPFPARVVDISRSGPPEGSAIEHVAADLADVASWGEVSRQIADIIEAENPDRAVFIHAAGTLNPIGFAGEVDFEPYVNNVVLNSAAGQVLGHAFLSAVRGRHGTYDLVMISSGAASNDYPGWSAYGSGKAALDQWVRYAGAEQKLRGGVRVAAIAPGVMDTEMQAAIRSMSEEEFPRVQRFRDLHEQGKLVAPEDAARRLWDAVESGLDPGSVLDLRDF
ncbi:MAG: SDR family NAD(P)-dependent oxidoreductase [Acidimicrobiia bacterium]